MQNAKVIQYSGNDVIGYEEDFACQQSELSKVACQIQCSRGGSCPKIWQACAEQKCDAISWNQQGSWATLKKKNTPEVISIISTLRDDGSNMLMLLENDNRVTVSEQTIFL